MPITVTCPNPSCGQVCAVQDQYAGMQVSCPKCQTVFAVPAAAAPVQAAPVAAAPAPIGAPVGPGFAGIMNNLALLAGAPLNKTLVLAGLGCLFVLVISTFLPWIGTPSVDLGGIDIGGGKVRLGGIGGISFSGVQFTRGILILLLSIGALAFVAVSVVMNRADLFNYSVLAGGGWGAAAALWVLITIIDAGRAGSFGLYFALLAAVGAAGTFGFVALPRLMNRAPVASPPM